MIGNMFTLKWFCNYTTFAINPNHNNRNMMIDNNNNYKCT